MKRTLRNRSRYVPLAAGVLLALVVLVFFRAPLASVLWRVVGPVVTHSPLSSVVATISSKVALQAENESLRASLATATATLADRDTLYQENLALKVRLGREVSARSILAGVVMRPPGVPYDTLVIDAGQREGITKGSGVFAGGTTYIGEVDEVYATTARVVLLSSPQQSHQALLIEQATGDATPVLMSGQGGASLVAEVPAHTKVRVGDSIVFPGVRGGFVAKVSDVILKGGESFGRVYAQLPVNPQELRFVEVRAD